MIDRVVYVVQNPVKRVEGELRPRVDLRPAQAFGRIRILAEHNVSSADATAPAAMEALKEGLRNYRPQDYLLLVGDPALIGWATAIAAKQTGGLVRILKWERERREYIETLAQLWTDTVTIAKIGKDQQHANQDQDRTQEGPRPRKNGTDN